MRSISLADYRRGQGLTPSDWSEAERLAWYDRLATEGAADALVRSATWRALVPLLGRPVPDLLERLLFAVRAVAPFRPDAFDADGWRAPRVTFVEGGDCEDLATLLVAMTRAAREIYQLPVYARLVWIKQPGRALDHVTAELAASDEALDETPVVVSVDGEIAPRAPWVWAEASVPGAALGEDPYAALVRARALVKAEDVLGRALAPGGGA